MGSTGNRIPVIAGLRVKLLSGEKITCIGAGEELHSQDIRKCISDLRYQGWLIDDLRIKGNRKLYWLRPDQLQEMRERFHYTAHLTQDHEK